MTEQTKPYEGKPNPYAERNAEACADNDNYYHFVRDRIDGLTDALRTARAEANKGNPDVAVLKEEARKIRERATFVENAAREAAQSIEGIAGLREIQNRRYGGGAGAE